MADREKVIKGLECHVNLLKCHGCPYVDAIHPHWGCHLEELIADAFALLKEHGMVEPTRKVNENGQILSCSNCGTWLIVQKQKYCHECGRAVKWDD